MAILHFSFSSFLTPKLKVEADMFQFPVSRSSKCPVKWRCRYIGHTKVLMILFNRIKTNIWYYEQIWNVNLLLHIWLFCIKLWDKTPQPLQHIETNNFFQTFNFLDCLSLESRTDLPAAAHSGWQLHFLTRLWTRVTSAIQMPEISCWVFLGPFGIQQFQMRKEKETGGGAETGRRFLLRKNRDISREMRQLWVCQQLHLLSEWLITWKWQGPPKEQKFENVWLLMPWLFSF